MLRLVRLAATGTVAAALIGGAVAAAPADAATARCTAGNTTTITYDLRGSTLSMPRNTCLRVALTTHSDGGYYWRTTKAAAQKVLASVSKTQVYPKSDGHTVGGNSTTYYLYRAASKGSTSFTLAEHRGDQKQKGDWGFHLTVHVR